MSDGKCPNVDSGVVSSSSSSWRGDAEAALNTRCQKLGDLLLRNAVACNVGKPKEQWLDCNLRSIVFLSEVSDLILRRRSERTNPCDSA